jgi:hypothetical protein
MEVSNPILLNGTLIRRKCALFCKYLIRLESSFKENFVGREKRMRTLLKRKEDSKKIENISIKTTDAILSCCRKTGKCTYVSQSQECV